MDPVMMGLRLNEGIPHTLIKSNKYSELVDSGLLEASGSNIRATAKGRPLLNAILSELLV